MPSKKTPDKKEPSEEISLEAVKKRTVSGVVVLTGRTFILSIISLVATGLLTVYLTPGEFGVFWAVTAIVSFLAYFSDVGLAAALIQRKEKLTREDLGTTFTVQQGLVLVLLLFLIVLTPFFIKYYHFDQEDRWLMYALGLSLLMSSFKTIPSILLERKLEFGKLIIPQILENLIFNITAVFLAWKGYGIMSFTYAVLLRSIVGLVSMYLIQPWLPKITVNRNSLSHLLKYGVPYQANTLLATLKDDGMTAFLGIILGTTGLGFLGWAQKWGQAPLRFFMDHVIKVTFPAFSRMQDKPDHLKQSVTRSIFFICFLVYPTMFGILIIAPVLVVIIPKYIKWAPALTALSLIGLTTLLSSVTTQITNLLNAIGRIKTTFKLMIMWTALTWLFIPFMAYKYGVNGAAFGYVLVSLSSVIAIYIAKKYVDFSLKKSVVAPLVSSVAMAVVLIGVRSMMAYNIVTVIALVVIGMFLYMVVMYFFTRGSIINDLKRGTRILFSK